jgi:hypothetical protein
MTYLVVTVTHYGLTVLGRAGNLELAEELQKEYDVQTWITLEDEVERREV